MATSMCILRIYPSVRRFDFCFHWTALVTKTKTAISNHFESGNSHTQMNRKILHALSHKSRPTNCKLQTLYCIFGCNWWCITKRAKKLKEVKKRWNKRDHLPDVFPAAIFVTRSTPPPITKSLMRLLVLKGFSCSFNCFWCFRCNWCCWCCSISRSRSWNIAMRSCSAADDDDMIALAVISVVAVVGTVPPLLLMPLVIDDEADASASNLVCCCSNCCCCCCWSSSSLNGMLLFICFGLLFCVDCIVIDDEDDKAVTGRCHCISANKTIGKLLTHRHRNSPLHFYLRISLIIYKYFYFIFISKSLEPFLSISMCFSPSNHSVCILYHTTRKNGMEAK